MRKARGTTTRDPIVERRGAELGDVLSRRGWRVASRTREGLAWWADEEWTLESERTPAGARAVLTFLVDPMSEGVVWALAASERRMTGPLSATSATTIRVRHEWEPALEAWLDALDGLRDRAAGGVR